MDLVTGSVVRPGSAAALTTRETDLLRFLVANRDRVVSREQILSDVFGYADDVVSRACDNTVRRLRTKIEADAANPDHLFTAHGTGYRFVLDGKPTQTALPEPVALPLLALGPVRIDLERRRVLRPEGERTLGEGEAALLDALIRADGRVVERRALIRAGWGEHAKPGQRVLDNTMSALRAKIEPDPSAPRYLHTFRGTGYRLARPPDRAKDPDLFGRAALIDAGLVAIDAARWVLLVGPPGVGKSRLARHLAGRVDRAVLWIDGTGVRSVAEGAAAIAAVTGTNVGAADPVFVVRRVLASSARTLVVLDNLEHAPDVFAALIGRLAEDAPDVKWLGTSRIRIDVPGERVVEVEPLDADAAAELFVCRAAAACPGSPRIDAHLPAVRQIVDRLDRLPLALELAAPRLRVLTIDELLARLGVDLLVRSHAGDERHRSLRAALETSLEALTEAEFGALVQISTFTHGLFVDDAEGLFGDDAVDLLQTLRDHSLLRVVPDATGLRFATWHAVCELVAPARDADVVRRHCAWLGRRGLGSWERDTATDAARHRALLEEDIAATRLALALGEHRLAAGCALAAAWTRAARGPFAAGLALVDEVLAHPVPSQQRGSLLIYRAFLRLQAGRPGRLAEADGNLLEAVAIARECDRPGMEMEAAVNLSYIAEQRGDRDGRRTWLVRAAEAGERIGASAVAFHRAEIAVLDGDHALAYLCYTRALAVAREPSVVLQALGRNRHRAGALDEARTRLEQAYAVLVEHGRTSGLRSVLHDLVQLAYERGDLDAQERWAAIGLEVAAQLPNVRMDVYTRAMRARGRTWGGRLAEALEDLVLAEASGAEADAQVRAHVAEVRAQWCWVTGDIEGTAVAAQQAVTGFVAAGDAGAAACAERHLARVCLARADREGARAHIDRAWAAIEAIGMPHDVALVACTVAEVTGPDAAAWVARVRALCPEGAGSSGTELGQALDRLTSPRLPRQA